MCIKQAILHNKKLLLCIMGILISITLLYSCSSTKKPSGYQEVLQNGLRQLPKLTQKQKNGKIHLNVGEYTVTTNKIIKKLEKGRVDLSGKLKYTERRLFEIKNIELSFIDNAESLFIYNKEGFDNDTVTLGTFYGRTSEDAYPFTISLSANKNTRIFDGKAKRKDVVFDIKGTPYLENNIQPESKEIAFFVRLDNKLIGYIQVGLLGIELPKMFIDTSLEPERRQMLLYTLIFLAQFKRYEGFLIQKEVIEGEK